MTLVEWLQNRSPEELILHRNVLKHAHQTDFKAHSHRRLIGEELCIRAERLSEFMSNIEKGDRAVQED